MKLILVLASILAVASSVRVDPFLEVQSLLATSADGGLRGSAQGLLEVLRRGKGRKGDEESEMGIFSIKFFVPPSETKGFEDKWTTMSDKMKDDKPDIFTLKRAKLTNMLYYSYAEYECMEDVHNHFTSKHFEDFSDWVDDHGIKWEMELLKTESSEIERKQRKQSLERRKRYEEDEETHVLVHFNVPPAEYDTFVDQWTKCAEETIREDENSVYSLRKVATDNTRFWGYGTWDSLRSYTDHFHSKHLGKFMDYTQDADVTWIIIPLEEIGGDSM